MSGFIMGMVCCPDRFIRKCQERVEVVARFEVCHESTTSAHLPPPRSLLIPFYRLLVAMVLYGRSSLDEKSATAILPLTKRDLRPKSPASLGRQRPRRPLLILFALIMSAFLLISLSYPQKLWTSFGSRLNDLDSTWLPPAPADGPPWMDDILDEIPSTMNHDLPDSDLESDYALWSFRAEEVKAEFLGAYNMYEEYAMPHDELRPLTKSAIDKYCDHSRS